MTANNIQRMPVLASLCVRHTCELRDSSWCFPFVLRLRLAVVLGQRFLATLDRFHVIAINAEPLVFVGRSPRVSSGILNAENDNRQNNHG